MKTALITGAGKRIGRAIALALAREGWGICAHYHASREEAEALVSEITAAGGRAWAIGADLSKPEEAETLIARARDAAGTLSALINNASVFLYDTPDAFDARQFELQARTNLLAPILLAREFAKQFFEGGNETQGVILNLLDQKLWNLNPDFFTYTLSKSGLRAATEMMAMAYAPRVRVCAVAPGITLPSPKMSEENFQKARAKAPLGYSSTPEDIANTALYLLGTPSITGHTVIVDGGQHLARAERDVMFDAPKPSPLLPASRKDEAKSTYTIFFRDLELVCFLGINEEEKQAKQRVLVNIELEAKAHGGGDEIHGVLNYDRIRQEVMAVPEKRHIHLQETLCAEILELCLNKPHIVAAKVSTEKPDIYPGCKGVGVTMRGVK